MDDTPQQEPERVCIYGRCGNQLIQTIILIMTYRTSKSPNE